MPEKPTRMSPGQLRRMRAGSKDSSVDRGPGVAGVIGLLLVVVLGGIAIIYFAKQAGDNSEGDAVFEDDSTGVSDELEESVRRELEAARREAGDFEKRALEVAEKFLEESDPVKRLEYVRNRDEVATRIGEYHEETRTKSHTGFYKIGANLAEGMRSAAFAVRYDHSSMRLLEVVDTDEGAKVDWDSYARHSTVPWDELMSDEGRDEGVVRVFVKRGYYYNPPFDDSDEWQSFQILNPDINRAIHGYAKAGSELAKRIETAVGQSPDQRQHMMLRIKRQPGPYDKQLYSVEELVTLGWVLPDKDKKELEEN